MNEAVLLAKFYDLFQLSLTSTISAFKCKKYLIGGTFAYILARWYLHRF